MNIPIISNLIRVGRDRAKVMESRRLRKMQLDREWADADRRHKVALAEHQEACRQYHINPSDENLKLTWLLYHRTWGPYNECFEIWRKRCAWAREEYQ